MRRVLRASADRVYEAWTRPELILRWMFPPGLVVTAAEMDVRVGGGFRFVMTDEEGDKIVHGEYRDIVPSRRLAFTFVAPGTEGAITLVTVDLRPLDGATELTLVHENFADRESRERHAAGWVAVLEGLAALLDQAAASESPST